EGHAGPEVARLRSREIARDGNRARQHGRAAGQRRGLPEGREGAGPGGDRDRRGRQEAREDLRARRQGRLAARRGDLRGREPAQDQGGGGEGLLDEAGRGGREGADAVGRQEAPEGRGGGARGRRDDARRGRRSRRGRAATPAAAEDEDQERRTRR